MVFEIKLNSKAKFLILNKILKLNNLINIVGQVFWKKKFKGSCNILAVNIREILHLLLNTKSFSKDIWICIQLKVHIPYVWKETLAVDIE